MKINAVENYNLTRKAIGYIPRKEATEKDYRRIGFMSGLEVHQQLKTKEKLFCNCPAGIYQKPDDYDAEIIRHMRPTLSELGEYDGTALMEFKTRKEIVYRIKHETACTYEIDDTPPFKIDREALDIALEIAMLCKLNIVGEVHITRKQYLDGSIPTGFQRTAILGVEGELELPNRKVRLIQLSIEEDSCREVSDIGHRRVYMTDRLGMPLIETVTYPDMRTPDEVKEVAEHIRFLNRSTGKVRIGIGSSRQDVNVSCKGGTRVEIKGVSHNKWIPELTHNECFRQWALLHIREKLLKRISNVDNWTFEARKINAQQCRFTYRPIIEAIKNNFTIYAVKLPYFRGILSHFTQPGRCFAHEISERLKVIACLEQPNMISDEDIELQKYSEEFESVYSLFNHSEHDAYLLFWGPDDDMKTALETIEERCRLAFKGVPNETRKALSNGITIFERVLPGPDRMYPDTDSAPIPLSNEYLEQIAQRLPVSLNKRYQQLVEWNIPKDAFTYILRNNLVPLIEKIHNELNISPRFVATLLAHRLKNIQGKFKAKTSFQYEQIFDLFKFIKENRYELSLATVVLKEMYLHPEMDFDSILHSIKFQRKNKDEIISFVHLLQTKFVPKHPKKAHLKRNWIMGKIRPQALGNVNLKEIYELIEA